MERKKRLLVLLTRGMESPATVRSALLFAAIGASMDVETTLYCVQEGADVLIKGYPEREHAQPGKPTVKQRLAEAIAAGVKLEVCEATTAVREIKQEDLIEQARIVGAAKLIDMALESDATLCF